MKTSIISATAFLVAMLCCGIQLNAQTASGAAIKVYDYPVKDGVEEMTIKNLTFRNISFTGDESTLSRSIIRDYDSTRGVHDVTFENITVNGRKFNPETEIDWEVIGNRNQQR